jgi:hypothetical protein
MRTGSSSCGLPKGMPYRTDPRRGRGRGRGRSKADRHRKAGLSPFKGLLRSGLPSDSHMIAISELDIQNRAVITR